MNYKQLHRNKEKRSTFLHPILVNILVFHYCFRFIVFLHITDVIPVGVSVIVYLLNCLSFIADKVDSWGGFSFIDHCLGYIFHHLLFEFYCYIAHHRGDPRGFSFIAFFLQ